MATSQSTIDGILDQLSSVPGIAARKMFGEYALYHKQKVIALVCDNTLFFKMTDEGKKYAGSDWKEGHPYPGAKAAIQVNDELLDNPDRLAELALITSHHLPEPKKKK